MTSTRRDFLSLSAAAAAFPRVALAQQAAKMWRVGLLAPNGISTFGPIADALKALGWAEGQNIAFVVRDAAGQLDRLDAMAADLVALRVDVIVASTAGPVGAAQRATRQIPIVMAAALEPVASGFIAGLAHPGGNITGVAAAPGGLEVKMLDMFREIRPGARRVAVVTGTQNSDVFLAPILAAASSAGIMILPVLTDSVDDLEFVFTMFAAGGAEAVIASPNLVNQQFADLALRYRLPSFAVGGQIARLGGLLGYNGSFDERARLAASYVDAILKGAQPADLAVQQASKFDLTINMKTAKALGLTVPPSILLQATEVIE